MFREEEKTTETKTDFPTALAGRYVEITSARTKVQWDIAPKRRH